MRSLLLLLALAPLTFAQDKPDPDKKQEPDKKIIIKKKNGPAVPPTVTPPPIVPPTIVVPAPRPNPCPPGYRPIYRPSYPPVYRVYGPVLRSGPAIPVRPYSTAAAGPRVKTARPLYFVTKVDDKWWWELTGPDGQALARSVQSYPSRTAAWAAVTRARAWGQGAAIVERAEAKEKLAAPKEKPKGDKK